MILKAIVKLIGEEAKGVSQSTGNEWKAKLLLLEWTDMEGTNRAWGQLYNERLNRFDSLQINQGDECEVSLNFSARTYRTGYSKTDVNIIDIKKVESSQQ